MGKYTYIDRDVLVSNAFNSLAAAPIRVYLHFLLKRKMVKRSIGKRKKWVQVNNGELVFTYAMAKKDLNMPSSTFMNCIDRLVAVGLLDIPHSGAGGKKGDVSLYSLSERWRKFGTPEFIQKSRPKDNRSGRGFAAYPENRKNRSKV